MPSPSRVTYEQLSSPLHSSSHVWPAGQPRAEPKQAPFPPQVVRQIGGVDAPGLSIATLPSKVLFLLILLILLIC